MKISKRKLRCWRYEEPGCPEQLCVICGKWKPYSAEFWDIQKYGLRLIIRCRECVRKRTKKYNKARRKIEPRSYKIPSKCPYCGKQHEVTKEYQYIGRAGLAHFYCYECSQLHRKQPTPETEQGLFLKASALL